MARTIIHVDMDAFYAAVEARDDPSLRGRPLIIGALPHERGVVATCSYEARKYGVHSAMSIKEAHRLCPNAVYMHPKHSKYREASDRIHEIWLTYTDIIEYISLDEGFLDVSGSGLLFGTAMDIALSIKDRTKKEAGLTCSVGIGYSMSSAKLASEERKPDGLFEIPGPESLKALIMDRSARVIYGVGPKTADTLQAAGIRTVRDIIGNKDMVARLLGSHGEQVIGLAEGIDDRSVTPFYESEAKSMGREYTFQKDITDFGYLRDVLRLIAKELSLKLRLDGIFAHTVTLKVKYGNMQQVTRSRSGEPSCSGKDFFRVASAMLDSVEKRPVRLVGISLSGFAASRSRQLSLEDMESPDVLESREALDKAMLGLQRKYGGDIIRTGDEMIAEKRFKPGP